MSTIFCCSSPSPYKSRILSHESKFTTFRSWAQYPQSSTIASPAPPTSPPPSFALQVVQQKNFGPLESKRYFVATDSGEFAEVAEQWLIDANFEKLNT